jgi:outer membrane murein-binding lipoprotein Lpp
MNMKPIIAISLVAIVTTAGILAGCSSPTGYQKGARAATAINAAADDITQTSAQVERTIVALNDLVKRPQPDLRPQFRTFTAAVDNLDSIARRVSNQADNMRSRGAAYFDQWSQDLATIQNEDIRSRSQARQKEVAARFQAVAANYDQAKAGLQPFLSDLRDVQRFLATDLTPGGIGAVEKFAAKANDDAVPLRKSLDSLADEFREMGVSLSASVPAPQP